MQIKRISFVVSLTVALLLAIHTAHAQLPAPRMYLVTVNPETGYDEITWTNIPMSADDYFSVAVRIPPSQGFSDAYMPIAVNLRDTVYVNTNTESSHHSAAYTVWGVHVQDGISSPGLFNSPDSTISLVGEFNSNDGTISLNWNDYNSWRGSITAYNIYRRMGPGNYQLFFSFPEGTNTITIANIAADQQYDLFIEAVNADGIRRSTSNVASISTNPTQLPVLNITSGKAEFYPVPAGRILYIKSNKSGETILRLDILNADGEIILSDLPVGNCNTCPVSIDVSKIPNGFYICNLIYLSGIRESLRFIK
jgi:hypothetical protein